MSKSVIYERYSLIIKRTMKALLKKCIEEETWQTIEGQPKILESAIDIMEHFQRTLKGVTDISHGQTLYEVFRVFKKYLMQYSDAIASRLPRYTPPFPTLD